MDKLRPTKLESWEVFSVVRLRQASASKWSWWNHLRKVFIPSPEGFELYGRDRVLDHGRGILAAAAPPSHGPPEFALRRNRTQLLFALKERCRRPKRCNKRSIGAASALRLLSWSISQFHRPFTFSLRRDRTVRRREGEPASTRPRHLVQIRAEIEQAFKETSPHPACLAECASRSPHLRRLHRLLPA